MNSSVSAEAERVLAQAQRLFDSSDVDAAYRRMAEAIQADYADKNPVLLVVMTGGLVPAAGIIRHLQFPFELDYLHATRYQSGTQGHELVWKHRPNAKLRGRHVLVIDDILDEGNTWDAIREALGEMSPASVRLAILADKIHNRRMAGIQAEYVGVEVGDYYVFGSGMDYKEYWRQLPGIYAVKQG